MIIRKLRLFAITGGKQEGDAEIVQPVGNGVARLIAQVDVEHRHIRLGSVDRFQRMLDGASGGDVICSEPLQYVLGVEGDDEAVLDEQDGSSFDKLLRGLPRR